MSGAVSAYDSGRAGGFSPDHAGDDPYTYGRSPDARLTSPNGTPPWWTSIVDDLLSRTPMAAGLSVWWGGSDPAFEAPQPASVMGQPSMQAAINRSSGERSGFVGLHMPGADGRPDRNVALLMDAAGDLTAPGAPQEILGRASPDGSIMLNDAGLAALGLSPSPEPLTQTGGAGAPPIAVTPGDTAGCEEPARGEPGRSAGQLPLPQRIDMPAALRGDSAVARQIVLQNDPSIAEAGLGPSDWVAHHLITREAAGSTDYGGLFDAAAAAGWREDSASNVVGLPTNCPAQEALARVGVHRPEHVGSHPTWNGEVRRELKAAQQELDASNLREGSPQYNAMAKQLLDGIEGKLRSELSTMERVTDLQVSQNDVPV